MNSVQKIMDDLQCFIGSENFYRHLTGLVYTDGVRYLAEKCGAYWLIDLIASYQPKLRVPFQLWQIKVNSDCTATVTVQEDSDMPVLIKQDIGYTDFPFDFKLYVADGVLMLPGEY